VSIVDRVRDLYVRYSWRREPVVKGVTALFNY